MDKTRIADLTRLENDLKTETRPNVKKLIKEAHTNIKNQTKDRWLASARESLVRESKKNPENVKQIHEDIKKHERMGIGRTSFWFDLSGIKGFEND